MLFAIDAGDQVEAVDEQSDYPPNAPREDDLSGFEPNVEAISTFEPDLVIVEGSSAVTELETLDVPVLQMPAAATLDDSYEQIEQLGAATGHITAATELVTSMKTDIDELVAKVPQPVRGIKVYHEVDDTLYTVTGNTFLGQIYQLAGLSNIAANIGGGQDYTQISAEQVISDNPDWIFLAYGDHDTITEVKDRPGWDQIVAVQDDQIVTLDPDIASRWGPRTVDLLETLIQVAYPGA
jgi:iron complex transport system substrate-binding protein